MWYDTEYLNKQLVERLKDKSLAPILLKEVEGVRKQFQESLLKLSNEHDINLIGDMNYVREQEQLGTEYMDKLQAIYTKYGVDR